ncbi:hypothetical protein [uncultured Corynebacterium sp.]|uniref:hypothetical protein n=1 Tax=uncultured Corynebacterium sp. TaxID=159447 RepID=UPI00259846F4|nr:hypothetical protein [uncultured Corynebacterium sp.]
MDYGAIARDLLADIRLLFKWAKIPANEEEAQRIESRWARSFASAGVVYPAFVYSEALDSFFAQASAKDDPPLPGDILRHCRVVVERIERDPSRRPALERWRDERRGIKS